MLSTRSTPHHYHALTSKNLRLHTAATSSSRSEPSTKVSRRSRGRVAPPKQRQAIPEEGEIQVRWWFLLLVIYGTRMLL